MAAEKVFVLARYVPGEGGIFHKAKGQKTTKAAEARQYKTEHGAKRVAGSEWRVVPMYRYIKE